MEKMPSKPQIQSRDSQKSSIATVMGMTQSPVKDKPGVTRITLTLDREASFSTSREGNQLIVNVFNAQMASSLTPVKVDDPVVKGMMAKQTGNSVKGMIDLVNPDVAYTPSKAGDPQRIFIDVWQITPQAGMKKGENVAVIKPTSTKDSGDVSSAKEITVELQPVATTSKAKEMSVSQPSSEENMPAQLQWFSEKLSQVLQEREKMKQDLLDIEQKVAVKDSMIQVLERKIKEANLRIVELEEDVIKTNSQSSLIAQNEQAMRNDLQKVLNELEGVSGGASTVDNVELKDRSDKILSKISELQQQNVTLAGAKDQVDSLRQQFDALLKERDDLRAQNDASLTEVESLKGQVASLTAMQQQLQAKEYELAKLRKAIGEAAQLVSVEPSRPVVQPVVRTVTPKTEETSQALGTSTDSEMSAENPAQMIAQLTQMQTEAGPSEYILGPDDVLEIKVLNEENWDATVTVSSDGFITYSLLGDLRVDGLTTEQLDAQITSLLERDFFVAPEVTVDVSKPRSKKVYIMGQVKQPGYHELEGDQRLLGTLLKAGGPSSFMTEAKILRLPKGGDMVESQGSDAISPIIVDLNRLFQQGDQTQNVQLQDGDVIMIADKGASTAAGKPALGPGQIYVVGSVAKPGIYNHEEADTVLDAILRAGGFTEFASRNGTKVVRDENGKTKTIQVKMKDVMEKGEMDKNIAIVPGDMIIVPESFF